MRTSISCSWERQPSTPEFLTIGFARRLATYKRLNLLVHDATRALALLDHDRPMQLVFAGKAHPLDDGAKAIAQRMFELKRSPAVGNRVVFVEDYDLRVAGTIVAGCDVWLNLPRPPLEASGTSGMKAALNGGLNLSVLDGWWREGFDGQQRLGDRRERRPRRGGTGRPRRRGALPDARERGETALLRTRRAGDSGGLAGAGKGIVAQPRPPILRDTHAGRIRSACLHAGQERTPWLTRRRFCPGASSERRCRQCTW